MGVPKAWLSELRALVGGGSDGAMQDEVVGILAYEAAATMARLVSLHKALSEPEILRLRSDIMRSQGVSYLNSTDQPFLLRLACAELMTDLDRAASVISRLDKKRQTPAQVKRFNRVYTDLKAGNSADLEQYFGSWFSKKEVEKKVRKMEKFIVATSKLCTEMDALEVSRQKLNKQWTRYSGPIPAQKLTDTTNEILTDIKSQHQKIHKLKDESLWNQTFEKVVKIMAPSAFFIFARICAVFGPFVPGLPPVVTLDGKNHQSICFAPVSKLRVHPRLSSSGPMEKKQVEVAIRNSCPIFGSKDREEAQGNWRKDLEAPVNSVGGSSMALRYADVIVSAEKILVMKSTMEEKERRRGENAVRHEVYEMLPMRLREAVRKKLRECWRDPGPLDGCLADGWKEAVERILRWLGPMAHDTLRWQAERNMDRRRWFDPQPKAFLLQTLHFSDMEKTEAAIVEVLVGLSCVCWYEERRYGSLRLS
ncbi:hypothetical protein J5N97_015016 [Dioscorea zingiberensis]|uniref:Uncharacterized protein n=1 Tax=Dioscorea zingiberensis TaxID=325984 RepID=A0A9D5CVR1_9LILI|nr:hypothetical protein J5N97_015016 [Dioscorea zingiberensis]